MATVLQPEFWSKLKYTHYDLEDWQQYTAAGKWTAILTDSGTAAVAGAGGKMTLSPSDGSVADNDESYIQTTTLPMLVASGKPIDYTARLQFTEAATNAANIFNGIGSAIAANQMVDDGGGMITTGNYFVFYKVDGATTWSVRSRNSTTTYTNDTGVTAGGSTPQKFEIFIVDETPNGSSTNVIVTFKIDDQVCFDTTTKRSIAHIIPISGSVAMARMFGSKNGSANQQTVVNDYNAYAQTR